MANLQATLRGQAHYNPGARDCLAWANRLLFRSTDPEKFATCLSAVLDPAAHALDYANAGHERSLRFGGDDGVAPRRLIRGGLMLGALPHQARGQARLSSWTLPAFPLLL